MNCLVATTSAQVVMDLMTALSAEADNSCLRESAERRMKLPSYEGRKELDLTKKKQPLIPHVQRHPWKDYIVSPVVPKSRGECRP